VSAARAVHAREARASPSDRRRRTTATALPSRGEEASGRERLRERVPVEHRLAHLAQKQGLRARYLQIRPNLFDLRRHAAVLNLEVVQNKLAEAA
jgi:hypothetical protein